MTWPRVRRAIAGSSLLLVALGCLAVTQAGAERSGRDGVIVSLDGEIHPDRLPRDRPAPVSLSLRGSIVADRGGTLPDLDRIEVAFGAHGGLDAAGLPVCPRGRLLNATQSQALERCRPSLVGRGTIEVEVPLNPEEPVRADASVLLFNGRYKGGPAVWVHAYSAAPPVSFVIPFRLKAVDDGTYGMLLQAPVGSALGRWPRLRSFDLTLGRRYRYRGAVHSYLSASCPLPPRFHHFPIPLARATYTFSPRPSVSVTKTSSCQVSE